VIRKSIGGIKGYLQVYNVFSTLQDSGIDGIKDEKT